MPVQIFYETNGTNDCLLLKGSATFAGARSGNADQVNTSNQNGGQIECTAAQVIAANFVVARQFISFDTSIIGAASTINSATIKIFQSSVLTFTDDSLVHLRSGTQALPPSVTDYQNFGATDLTTAFLASTVGTNGSNYPLNGSGLSAINKTGITKFSLLIDQDVTNTAPAVTHTFGLDSVSVVSGQPTVGYQLIVTWNLVSPTVTGISPNTGATTASTNVTITGTGFQPGCTATVDGRAIQNLQFSSSTTLTGTMPPYFISETALDIVVTNPDTGTGTGVGLYTYTSVTPVILALSVISGPPSGGTRVVITGTGFSRLKTSDLGPPAQIQFGGVDATHSVSLSFFVQGLQFAIANSPPGTQGTIVGVSIRNPNGASATLASSFSYIATPSTSGSTGTQLLFDFTHKTWLHQSWTEGVAGTGAALSVASMAVDPTQGTPAVYGMATLNPATNLQLVKLFDENSQSITANVSTAFGYQGFIETFPLTFGGPQTRKQFQEIRLIVNDVTAVNVGGGVTSQWLCFILVDQGPEFTSSWINVPLQVSPQPFTIMPTGMVDFSSATNTGELVGSILGPSGEGLQGHSIMVQVYFPLGTFSGTPTQGVTAGPAACHLPWAVYQMDVVASLISESKVEP